MTSGTEPGAGRPVEAPSAPPPNGAEEADSIDAQLAKGRSLRASNAEHGLVLRAFRRATECGAPPLKRAEALREYGLALEPIGRHREAAAALEDAIALLSEDAPAPLRRELFQLASAAHERAGDLGRALERHRAAEARWREELRDVAGWYAREADLLERLGLMSELTQCYSRLVEAAPDHVLFAQPDDPRPTSAARERLRRLLLAINEHLAANPGDFVARIFKAGLFYRLGRYRHAEGLILRALETGHDHFYAYHLLGKIRSKRGRHGAALEALERARPLAPDYLDIERDRAAALEACDRKAEALEVYRRIEARWPGRREVLLRGARLREELGLAEEAYDALREAAAKGAPERRLLERVAGLAMRLGRPKEAAAHLDQALRAAGAAGPGTAALRLARSAARAAAGDLEGALEDAQAAERDAPDRRGGVLREALARRAELLVRLERGEDAVRAADALAALDQEPDERTLVLRGDALRAARRFPESVQCYREAADRKLAETLLDASATLVERAEYRKALGALNESFRRNPQSWEVFYLAAAAYARLGEAQPAAKYLEAAAKVNRGALALMEKDGDFDPVRESAEVKAVTGGAVGGG